MNLLKKLGHLLGWTRSVDESPDLAVCCSQPETSPRPSVPPQYRSDEGQAEGFSEGPGPERTPSSQGGISTDLGFRLPSGDFMPSDVPPVIGEAIAGPDGWTRDGNRLTKQAMVTLELDNGGVTTLLVTAIYTGAEHEPLAISYWPVSPIEYPKKRKPDAEYGHQDQGERFEQDWRQNPAAKRWRQDHQGEDA